MAIIIKEIQIKAVIQAGQSKEVVHQAQLAQLKKEIMRELKEHIRREHIRKYEY